MLSKFQPFFALQKLQHITRQDILGGNFDVLKKLRTDCEKNIVKRKGCTQNN